MCNEKQRHRPKGGKPCRSYRQSTPKRSFMNRLRNHPLWWTALSDRLIAVLRLTEDRQKLAHAEAMLMRVAGNPFMDMPTMEGDVLYLCLEDTFCRIQDRLFRLTDEASGRLHFAVASCKLSDGSYRAA